VSAFSWVLIILSLFPVVLVGIFSVVGAVVIFLVAALVIEAVLARRAALRQTSCSLLALAAGSGAELGPAVVRVGTHDRGIVGHATRRLMLAMERGMPLAEAIRRFPAALPREAPAYVAAGQVIGAEAEALEEMGAQDDANLATLWRTCVDRTVYLSAVMLLMIGIVTFMIIRIAPEYEKIFSEFGLELPAVTLVVMAFSQWFVEYWYLIALPIVWGVPLVIVCSILHLCDVPVLNPLFDRLFRSQQVSHVLRILAMAADHRVSLAPVIERLGQVFPAGNVRRSLRRVYDAVDRGGDWRDALLDARLIRPAEHALLGTAQQAGNLPWALRLVAQRGQRRLVYRWTTFVHVVFPLLIVAMGGVVGLFVVGMFMPLITLVEGLT
jgi:type II secretory pathway component PulF